MGVRGHRGADQSGIEMELYIYGGVLFFLNLSEPAAGQFFSRFGCCTNVSAHFCALRFRVWSGPVVLFTFSENTNTSVFLYINVFPVGAVQHVSWSDWEISTEETDLIIVLLWVTALYRMSSCSRILGTISCTSIKVHVTMCIYVYILKTSTYRKYLNVYILKTLSSFAHPKIHC